MTQEEVFRCKRTANESIIQLAIVGSVDAFRCVCT